jgi:hypothetical protein
VLPASSKIKYHYLTSPRFWLHAANFLSLAWPFSNTRLNYNRKWIMDTLNFILLDQVVFTFCIVCGCFTALARGRHAPQLCALNFLHFPLSNSIHPPTLPRYKVKEPHDAFLQSIILCVCLLLARHMRAGRLPFQKINAVYPSEIIKQ